MKHLILVSFAALALAALAKGARAADNPVELRFENRRFVPQTITVPSNRAFRIKVINASNETIEFESFKPQS